MYIKYGCNQNVVKWINVISGKQKYKHSKLKRNYYITTIIIKHMMKKNFFKTKISIIVNKRIKKQK